MYLPMKFQIDSSYSKGVMLRTRNYNRLMEDGKVGQKDEQSCDYNYAPRFGEHKNRISIDFYKQTVRFLDSPETD